MALFGALFLALLAGAHAELPGCKIRITSKALELGKVRGLRAGGRRGGPEVGTGAKGLCWCRSEAGGAALSGARTGDHHHSGLAGQRGPLLLQHF